MRSQERCVGGYGLEVLKTWQCELRDGKDGRWNASFSAPQLETAAREVRSRSVVARRTWAELVCLES